MDNQNAFILHCRPFKNTSSIIDFFTQFNGVISVVGKGIKRSLSKKYLVQPFIPLQIVFVGKGDLKTLTHLDTDCAMPLLMGKKILLGIYVNELILKLLQRHDPYPDLFQGYWAILNQLKTADDNAAEQTILRRFELKLLAELGYALSLERDGRTQLPIEKDLLYNYSPHVGLYEASTTLSHELCVSGASINALMGMEIMPASALREIKQLMRFILAHYLENKTIESRKLFQTKKWEVH